MIRIHQVLATLGYGDAIGHEVLGIQRVLRARRLRVRDLRRDRRLPSRAADRATIASWSTSAIRDNLLLHHFSLGSKASRTAFALPRSDGAHLPQHHAAGVLRRRAPDARAPVLSRPARAAGVRRSLRSGDGRLGVQPAGSRGARLSADRGAAGRSRLLASRSRRRTGWSRATSTTTGRTSLFVGRVIANKKIEDLIRLFHAYHDDLQPALAAADRRRSERLRALSGVAAPARRHARRVARALRRPRVRRRARRASTTSPDLFLVRQRARRLLRPARRGVLQAGAGARLRGDRRAVDDGRRGRAVRRQGSDARRGADGRDRLRTRRCRIAIVDGQLAAGRPAARRRTSPGTLLGFVDQILAVPRAPRPHVTFDFWSQFDAAQELEELRLYRPAAIYQALPGSASMIVNQWVAGGAQGRCDRRQRAARPRPAARDGPRVRALRADHRRRAARTTCGRSAIRRRGAAS